MIQQLLSTSIQLLFLNALNSNEGSADMASMLYSVVNTFNQLMKQLQLNLQLHVIGASNSTSSSMAPTNAATASMQSTLNTMTTSVSANTPTTAGATSTTVENLK